MFNSPDYFSYLRFGFLDRVRVDYDAVIKKFADEFSITASGSKNNSINTRFTLDNGFKIVGEAGCSVDLVEKRIIFDIHDIDPDSMFNWGMLVYDKIGSESIDKLCDQITNDSENRIKYGYWRMPFLIIGSLYKIDRSGRHGYW